ncbi:hypothetical protein GS429_03315 [Natronorubrum sp. JWXQ-INN-674]|uniref:DUF8106 domain-containing protein n=1 Tax=Natronorubrum halalkaliphilum TaxID=2691917 RepID=A0A6B0VIK1_9EURY|nr:hypothetical protein [Natronorubrum halalkaliphilum]MXV61103.1 hypothetical protein [Natronorubrum halalkaliphilum]
MTRPAPSSDERTPARRKSTLFCFDCDHESPVDGEWEYRTRDRYVEVVCPVCETTITKRPLPDEPRRERATARPSVTWRRAIRTTIQVWRTSVGIGLSSIAALTISHSAGYGQ